MRKTLLSLLIYPLLLVACQKYNYQYRKDISYGNYEERNLLDIAFPNNKDASSLIVYIHGGAWIGGSKEKMVNKYSKEYDDGYIYASINYRYASNEYHYNDILDDIQKAMIKIKDISEENDYHINKVAFFGHSAGGHLSLLYAYKNKDICPFEVAFVSSLCGPTDLSDELYLKESLLQSNYYELMTYMSGIEINASNFYSNKEALLEISPISYIDKACPTIISHGDQDSIVPFNNALTLKDKLEESHIPYDFFRYGGSDHDLGNSKKVDKQYQQKFKEYKEKYL